MSYDSARPWENPQALRSQEVFAQVSAVYAQAERQGGDNEVKALMRRAPMANVNCEVERTAADVRLVMTVGTTRTVYKLTAELAKSIGEELFKQGCNLEATTPTV